MLPNRIRTADHEASRTAIRRRTLGRTGRATFLPRGSIRRRIHGPGRSARADAADAGEVRIHFPENDELDDPVQSKSTRDA